MFKKLSTAMAMAFFSGILVTGASAAPTVLSDSQMDLVAAGGVDMVDGFVCPAIPGGGLVHNDKFGMIGDGSDGVYYSFAGPEVTVPVHATNRDGAGRPGPTNDDFSAPGDTDYSAIWGFRP